MPLPPAFEARLIAARALTRNVRELVFERVDGRPMTFQPGQWVNALVPVTADQTLKRSYSIASAPDGSSRFELAVTRVETGAGSQWLHEVRLGEVLRFVGPQGFFTRSVVNAPPSLMIATGTGVTPFRAMVRAALIAGSTAPIWILLGVRTEADVLYEDELRRLAREHSFLRFEPTLSQPTLSQPTLSQPTAQSSAQSSPSGWSGRRGYVQAHVRTLWLELVALGGTPHAFICGLHRMVGSLRQIMREELGVGREQVHSERYD